MVLAVTIPLMCGTTSDCTDQLHFIVVVWCSGGKWQHRATIVSRLERESVCVPVTLVRAMMVFVHYND